MPLPRLSPVHLHADPRPAPGPASQTTGTDDPAGCCPGGLGAATLSPDLHWEEEAARCPRETMQVPWVLEDSGRLWGCRKSPTGGLAFQPSSVLGNSTVVCEPHPEMILQRRLGGLLDPQTHSKGNTGAEPADAAGADPDSPPQTRAPCAQVVATVLERGHTQPASAEQGGSRGRMARSRAEEWCRARDRAP